MIGEYIIFLKGTEKSGGKILDKIRLNGSDAYVVMFKNGELTIVYHTQLVSISSSKEIENL